MRLSQLLFTQFWRRTPCKWSTGLLQGLEAAKAKRPTKVRIQLPRVYYQCSSGHCTSLSSSSGTLCSSCHDYHHTQPMTVLPGELKSLKKPSLTNLSKRFKILRRPVVLGQGFVRENITYMVTDNLEVMTSTTIRSTQILNKLKVATLADLDSGEHGHQCRHHPA